MIYCNILASPGVSVLVGQTHSAGGGGVPEEPPGWGRWAVQGSDTSNCSRLYQVHLLEVLPLLAVITRQRCKQVSGGACVDGGHAPHTIDFNMCFTCSFVVNLRYFLTFLQHDKKQDWIYLAKIPCYKKWTAVYLRQYWIINADLKCSSQHKIDSFWSKMYYKTVFKEKISWLAFKD